MLFSIGGGVGILAAAIGRRRDQVGKDAERQPRDGPVRGAHGKSHDELRSHSLCKKPKRDAILYARFELATFRSIQ